MKLIKYKKLIFRFDIGHKDGLGHYNRSLILIKYFLQKKFNVKICTNSKSKKFFNNKLQELIFLKKKNETEDKYINRISSKFKNYIIFIDKLYNYKQKHILNLKKKNELIFIQNFFKSSLLADKIIFPEIHNKIQNKKNKVFTGLKYFLIRNEILKIKKIDQKKNLAVTFGGSDPYNLTFKIYKILKKIKWNEKTIFYLGSSFSKDQKIKLANEIKKYKHFYISNFDIKKIANSKLIISSFGTFSYEMAYLKKLSFVVLLRKNIKIPTNYFFKNTINLGYYRNIKSEMLKNTLYKYLKINFKKNKLYNKKNAAYEYFKILKN